MLMHETDCLFMIGQAVRAPSGHNTQPWKFRVTDGGIDILPDFSRSLPVVDPDNRELFISLGCAAENLCLAASDRGYRTLVQVLAGGVVHVSLTRQDGIRPSPLLAQIPVRQTNRQVYDGRAIPDADIERLVAVEREPQVGVHVFRQGTPLFDAVAGLVLEGNRRQMQDANFRRELRHWMRYNRRHQDETRDGLSYAVFGAPNLPRFIASFIMSLLINEKSQNRSDRQKLDASSHLVLFTTRHDTTEEWVALGRTLQRLLLQATGLGIAHAYLNQPNEVPALAGSMAKLPGLIDEHPAVLIRLGYARPMPYSLRRPVESCLVA